MGPSRTLAAKTGMKRERHPRGPSVKVETEKRGGILVRCVKCGHVGACDRVWIRHRRGDGHCIHRCAECRSLNIISQENSLMKETWNVDEWRGCYPSLWRGVVVPAAMGHPAKFSSRLVRRIYEHLFAEGWVREGDSILDPFGGVALGALNAMEMGLRWQGVELEPKWVQLGEENLLLWKKCYKAMPRWSGDASLVQGDSRRLLELLHGQAGAVISSPPFRQSEGGTPEPKPGGVIDERLYARHAAGNSAADGYGKSDGQLANMQEGDFSGVVSSPPFRQSNADGGWQMLGKYAEQGRLTVRQVNGDPHKSYPSWDKERDTSYGDSEGQMANMKEGDFSGVVSSPPFQNKLSADYLDPDARRDLAREKDISNAEHVSPIDMEAVGGRAQKDARYGFTDGQMGNEKDDDFWLAARRIVEQVYQALQDGGHAVWVCKDFVRNGERVPFGDQWRQLCEAVGFATLHEHHALVGRDNGASLTLDGETVVHRKESKSFFRRLAEKKGSPRIDYEVVYCMEKRHEQ